jgi:F-type H+-transporting ATPase subunit a
MRSASIAGIDVLYVPFGAQAGEEHHEAAPATDSHAADTKTATKVDDHAAEAAEGTQYGILAPFLRSVNTDVNTPLAIAIYSFIFVELWGFQALGIGYLGKFFNFKGLSKGPMGLIDVFVGLLELVSELSRLVSFTFRLFGNVFAGEVLLTMMGFLVPLVLIDVFYGLELFVGAIQAFVFAMLTLVFAQSAVAHHGDDHEEGHEAAH